MKRKEAERITGIWNRIEEGEPDISTERLAAMTADQAGCGHGDVFEALAMTDEDDDELDDAGAYRLLHAIFPKVKP